MQKTFFSRKQRPERVIDMGGNIVSPGFIDSQINGAYGVDFSVYEGDPDAYRRGLSTVAEKIVETGVTSCVSPSLVAVLPEFILCQHRLVPTIIVCHYTCHCDCPKGIACRLRRNRSIRLCSRFFAPAPTPKARHFWDGTQKVPSYKWQSGELTPLYSSSLL